MIEPLLAWAARTRRDLPWRRTRDPWAILVSELMLQQTQVSRVVPRYLAFLERFPAAADCAAAPAGEVIRLWSGLGYNRRALRLQEAARAAVARHGGRIPDSLPDLLALPGVGPYTARAVLAFAYERDVAVLDGNAERVLSRALGRAAAQAHADALVPAGQGWAWNQGVLDLGATVCRPRPRCEPCPLAAAAACAWHGAGLADPDPWRRGTPQSRFEGSARQARGLLLQALRRGPVAWADVAAAAGRPVDAALDVAATLVADGLAAETDFGLRLP